MSTSAPTPAPLFPLQRSGESATIQGAILPDRTAVDYAELRRNHVQLPSNVFEGEQLKPVYKVVRQALDVAGSLEIPIAGNIFKFKDSTNSTDRLEVKFSSEANEEIPFSRGEGLNGMFFERLFIRWAATAGATAVIVVLFDPRDERAAT